jgi:hypothetical protein
LVGRHRSSEAYRSRRRGGPARPPRSALRAWFIG